MVASHLIAVRVTSELKSQFRSIAHRQALTESALLKRMITLMVESVTPSAEDIPRKPSRPPRDQRLCLRLRQEDQCLVHERAAARQMASATYAAVVLRAHLRSLSPLPKEELMTLKRSVAELSAIGRNLNQIAKALHQGGRSNGPTSHDLAKMLKVGAALRDHVKAVIRVNATSWETGQTDVDR